MTGAALRWFADVAVDVAVVEVGLGGTWDATNVIDAEIAVVTNVSHRPHAVSRRRPPEQIAAEKAGIVKKGSTLVLGETDPDLVADLHRSRRRRACCGATSTSARARTCRRSAGGCSSCSRPVAATPTCSCRCYGAHQGDNAAIALGRGRGVRRRAARAGGGLRRVHARAFAGAARDRRPAPARAARRRAQRGRRARRCATRSPRSSRPRRARS